MIVSLDPLHHISSFCAESFCLLIFKLEMVKEILETDI
jgi:hypothetical protein